MATVKKEVDPLLCDHHCYSSCLYRRKLSSSSYSVNSWFPVLAKCRYVY